jgi:hypothetical protein
MCGGWGSREGGGSAEGRREHVPYVLFEGELVALGSGPRPVTSQRYSLSYTADQCQQSSSRVSGSQHSVTT